MESSIAFGVAVFALGLLLGSFLNVCISRLPRGESVVRPRSHCPRCGHPIRPLDNIPVLSWMLLRGRCRDCREPISWRYPAVEIAVGLWLLLSFLTTRHSLAAVAPFPSDASLSLLVDGLGVAILGFLLIGLAVIDWRTHTLPDALTFAGIGIGFLFACLQAMLLPIGAGDIHFRPRNSLRIQSPGSFAARGDVFLTGPEALVLGRLAAIIGAAGLLLLIRAVYKSLRHREGLGLGDAKLLAMIAAFLGFGNAFLSFFFGMIACALFAVYLLTRGRADAATRLPLGSFLCVAGLLNSLLGTAFLIWYKSLL